MLYRWLMLANLIWNRVSSYENTLIASGDFVINRLDFNLGKISQPSDQLVGFQVTIHFQFEIDLKEWW